MKFKARDYQKECLVEITQAVEQSAQRALVVMAPGLGKTITSAFAVKEFFTGREFGRVLIICHSEDILRQSKAEYQKFFGEEYSYGMFVSNEKTTRQTDFLFATFQTMKDNRKVFPKDAFSYIVVDEAHHSKARTYFPTIRYFKPEFLLGLTATPDRLDGQKIEEIYGEPVYELNFVEATCRGLLAECDYELVLDDLSQEDIDRYLDSGEKLSIAQLNNTIFAPKRDEEIVRLIKKYSTEQEDPKTMIFCKSIEHARRITKLMGDEATLVHNGQSSSTNDIALDAFRDGRIRTIVSVQMLNEGINVPDANVVVFLRNTVSPSVFYQQLGRGVRPAPGKKKVKVLDFVGNCERIQTILELKQEIDDFRIQTPVDKPYVHGAGEADSREKFTLNIATPEFKAREVDIIDLLERAATGKRWTKEEIIAGLQKMYAEGKKVTCETVNAEPNLPNSASIAAKFGGSFDNALRAAGIPINVSRNMSREEMIRVGKSMIAHGEKITISTIDANPDLPSYGTLLKKFGSLENFRTACGVEGLSQEEMICAGREMVANGVAITTRTINDSQKLPTDYMIRVKFGSIAKFAALCGDDHHRHDRYSKESILEAYWHESKKAKHWLNGAEIRKNKNLASIEIYYKFFGRGEGLVLKLISEAQTLYGDILNDQEVMDLEGKKHSEEARLFREKQEACAKRYYEACVERGHWLSSEEVECISGLGYASYSRFFQGKITEMRTFAHELFGDLPNQAVFRSDLHFTNESNEKMLRDYVDQSRKAGHWLNIREINECSQLLCYSVYRKRFGGVKKLRQLAIEKYGDFTKENATN